MSKSFRPRDQIVYRPSGGGDPEHGFVVASTSETVFCRFWRPIEPWKQPFSQAPRALRTKANSEGCDSSNLEREDYGAEEAIRILCDAMEW